MIKKLSEYLKLSILLVGLLVGIQVPGFVAQYGHNLDARAAESVRSVAQFQDDADQFFDGNMDKLIAYYAHKKDPVVIAGGQSIEALVSRNRQLTQAQQAFHQTLYSPYVEVFISPITEIRREVWNNYDYQVILNASAIIVGLVFSLVALALFELTLFLIGAMWRGTFSGTATRNRTPRRKYE